MKGKICVVIAIVLLALSSFNASVVMAQTLKYAPAPQELPEGFYYTSIEIYSPQILDDFQKDCGVRPIYVEGANFYSGSRIRVLELSSAEDAKEAYSCFNKLEGEAIGEGAHIVGINTFGDESISYYHPRGASSTLFRNGRFVVYIEAHSIKNSEEESIIRYTLPKIIDIKLEQIKVPTPTPTPTPTPGEGVPGFKALFAIAGILAVAYLVKRRK